MAATTSSREIAAAWEPQLPGRVGPRDIDDPIVEPEWGGLRVVVAATGTVVKAFRPGAPVPLPDELHAAIAEAAKGANAVIEGHLSTAPLGNQAVMVPPPPSVPRSPMFFPRLGRSRKDDPFVHARHHLVRMEKEAPAVLAALAEGDGFAFVATDLLWLDGQSLLDVPLLERKRQLDGLLAVSELVRVTTFVRPSAVMTLVGWGALGFRELSWRGANSRYLAGRENPAWAIARPPQDVGAGKGSSARNPLG
jgi:hypothetical protein